jgi:hypothetical protein
VNLSPAPRPTLGSCWCLEHRGDGLGVASARRFEPTPLPEQAALCLTLIKDLAG